MALAVVAALGVSPPADASRFIRSGIFDDGLVLYNDPTFVFPLLGSANTQTVRVNLWWGGRSLGVAKRRPRAAADPADPAYDWETYDRTVTYAATLRIAMLFSILGTPTWANGGKGWNAAPTRASDLQAFARAAARRYNGTFRLPDGRVLPKVHYWLVWNEPNNPVFLKPQFVRRGGRWVAQSPRDYARMCNAVVRGVKSVRGSGKVACGATGPRGNNIPGRARASISPLAFLRGMRLGGATGFDAYAHHPYYGTRSESPLTPPPPGRRGNPTTAVTLGNFNTLVRELTRLYGNKRIWITEYGYQTQPQDRLFGVTYRQQAAYLLEAYRYARRHPRVDLFLWFLMRDDTSPAGWQSGLMTAAGRKKPSFVAFANLNS
jgi:Glycosyl hydrolase catalytic core